MTSPKGNWRQWRSMGMDVELVGKQSLSSSSSEQEVQLRQQ